jgi:MFS family permease
MRSTLNNIFRALRYRNFRLFFMGQSISLIGTWMQQVAMSWLVYRMTGSAFMLGVVAFASQIPSLLLSPIAGVMCDRWNRHRTLITTQTLAMIQALIMATLVMTHTVRVWHIVVLGSILGSINAMEIPVRQSFIIDMVEKKEMLGNAIALNSFMFNMARLIGPSIAGVLIAVIGEGPCFLANGLSFIAVIIGLFLMKLSGKTHKPKKTHILHGLMEGVRYVFGFPPIRHMLMLLSVISMMGMSYIVLMPVFAKNVLHGGPGTLGFLMAAGGIGALIATIFLASREKVMRLGRIIPVSAGIFAVGLVLFAFTRTLWISVIILAISGFGFMVHMAATNTILQTIVEDDKRGRAMSFYAMAFMGVAPFGSLLAGSLANLIGVTNAIIIGGMVCIIAALVFTTKIPMLKGHVKPIYDRITLTSSMNTISEITVPPED